MKRIAFSVALYGVLAMPAFSYAADPAARATLKLVDGKTHFTSGDRILVDLEIEALGDPVPMLRDNADGAYEVDDVVIAPDEGIHPWRFEKETYQRRCCGDVVPMRPLLKTLHQRLSIDERYRFDRPGTYRAHVVTHRAGTLESNEVTFSVEEPSSNVARARANELAAAFRAETDWQRRAAIARRLSRLPDAAATDAKLELLFGPASALFANAEIDGLWIARDRQRIVRTLEAALDDPAQDPIKVGAVLETLVDLETTLRHPYTGSPTASVPGPQMVYPSGPYLPERAQLRDVVVHRIAATLPLRSGRPQAQAAQLVVSETLADLPNATNIESWKQDADLVAAREALITVDDPEHPRYLPANVDRGFYDDPRMIPRLHRALDAPGSDDADPQVRAMWLRLLGRLEPSSVAGLIARESCAMRPVDAATFNGFVTTDSTTIDACLAEKLGEETAADAPPMMASRIDVSTMPYIARFASCGLTPLVGDLYSSLRTNRRHYAAPATALAYLVRCNPSRYRPLLDAAADADDLMLTFYLVRAATPPADSLRIFLRDRIAQPPSRTSSRYAYALWQINEASDEPFMRQRLAQLRDETGASPEKIQLEATIEQALQRGMGKGIRIP